MDQRMTQILREPTLIARIDDADCYVQPENEDEHSQRRLDIVRHTVQRRKQDENGIVGHRPNEGHQFHVGESGNAGSGNDWNYAQLLFLALVDSLCQVNEPNDLVRQKRLFEKIARTLVKTGLTSPICFSKQLHGLREHVRLGFMQIMNNAQKAVHFEDTQARNHPVSSANSSSNHRHLIPAMPPVAVLPNSMVPDRPNGSSVIVSRYKIDFEEMDKLGKGGFGAVYKVRHYLDGQHYAIKKIPLNLYNLDMCLRALREVKSLAALNHPNVVRYYSSWLEFDAPTENPLPRRRTGSTRVQVKVQELSDESVTNGYMGPFKLRHCLSSPDISSPAISGGRMVIEDGDFEASLPAVTTTDDVHTGLDTCGTKFALFGTLTLFLQMELCTSTLRTWLNERNATVVPAAEKGEFDRFVWVDKEPIKEILRQVLAALAYVHSQGVIHRDLKPGNVFLRSEPNQNRPPRVLLGDFGLSCYERDDLESRLPESENTGRAVAVKNEHYRHSTGMGTLAYSAPEQLKSQFYDCKADMFSFGIIALEMYFPFTTYMERIHNIMRCREGDLDEKFQRRMPLEAAIIRQLVQKKPSLRPSARQLLEEVVFVDDTQNVTALKQKLKEMEEEVARLRQMSALR